MIYDTPITVYTLPPGVGTLLQGQKLVPVFSAYCGELEVYHSRYWESVQAGSRVDRLVQLPMLRNVTAAMYAKYDGHVHEIAQAQFTKDHDGLPVTILSLRRSEECYDDAAV